MKCEMKWDLFKFVKYPFNMLSIKYSDTMPQYVLPQFAQSAYGFILVE